MTQASEFMHLLRLEASRMWRRRWLGVWVAWLVAAVGLGAVLTVKDRYEATARVYVDTQTVLKPLMAGLAFQPDIDQQVRMLARTLISRPNVEQLMRSPNIGLPQPSAAMLDREVERLKSQIRLESSGTGNLYTIAYRDTDPKRARRLVEGLLDLFVASGASVKQRDSEEAGRFIDEQIKGYEEKLADAENRLKDFKLRHFGVTGTSTQDYYARTAALTDEVNKLRLELGAAETSRDALRRELQQEDPQLPAESMPMANTPPAPTELEQRLQAQRRSLDELLRRYTEDHPDVVATKRMIGQLEGQRRAEQAATAASRSKGNAPTNPVYQRLRVSLAEAEAQVASLKSQLTIQQGRLDAVRAQASRVPQVEAELAQLNRDYDVMRKNYEQLVARREAASLGVKLDKSSSLADFRVVEPPQVSATPVLPSRKLLAPIAVLLALVAGVAAVFGVTRFRVAVDDETSLRALARRPVLGVVSMLRTAADLERERRARMGFAAMIGAFLVVNAAWVVWVVKFAAVRA